MHTGQVFGKWTVVSEDRSNGRLRYLCRCECGATAPQYGGNLTSGRSTSCGCATRAPSLVGKRFGRLTVVSSSANKGGNGAYLQVCRCDCGTIVEVERTNLRVGHTTSCGCFAAESTATRNATHGLAKHELYPVWKTMHARCYNPRNAAYPRYGGRGIKVHQRWHSFENFLQDVGDRPSGKSLDRIDNNGDYGPDNFRWATQQEQCNNKSDNLRLTARGRTLTQAQWARELGLPDHTIYNRLRRGWSVDEALYGKS